jgi:hypothetical protein
VYANLAVTVDGELIYAWKAEIKSNGILVVHKDAQDGSGNYAEPDGTVRFAVENRDIEIMVDF